MKPEDVLISIGLSKNEAKIYIELLSLGSSTVVMIAKKSKIHRTNVYDALDRLIEKGVVAHTIKENTAYYQAVDPDSLLNLLKDKEVQLKSIIPTLKLNYDLSKETTSTQIYEGVTALHNSFNRFLEVNEPIYTFGVPNQAVKAVGGFINEFHKKRIKKKMFMYHIYNEDAQERIIYLNNLPYTEARYLNKEYDSSIATTICGPIIMLAIFTNNPPVVIVIENQEIASAYKRYFDLLWAIAKK
jgi:sugar-specific transcriptional regulator TrmB